MGKYLEGPIRIGADLTYLGDQGKVQFGQFKSATAGYGLQLRSARPSLMRIHADDGGAAFASGYTYNCAEDRLLIMGAQTSGKTITARYAHVKIGGAVSVAADWTIGLWGYLETIAGATVQNGYGLRATVDVPSTATIGTNGVAGLVVDSIDLSGTHTGKASAIAIKTPSAGAWDYMFSFDAVDGHTAGSATSSKQILISIGGNPYAIAVCAVGT